MCIARIEQVAPKTRLCRLNGYLPLIAPCAADVRGNYARIDRLFSFPSFLSFLFLFFHFSFGSRVQPWLIILNRKSYRASIGRHAVEYARSGTPMGSHWTSPADPCSCVLLIGPRAESSRFRLQVNRNDLYRWQIITHLSSRGTRVAGSIGLCTIVEIFLR